MVADWSGDDDDSEQLFFTRIYIDAAKRVPASSQSGACAAQALALTSLTASFHLFQKSINITLDSKSRMFQNLLGSLGENKEPPARSHVEAKLA